MSRIGRALLAVLAALSQTWPLATAGDGTSAPAPPIEFSTAPILVDGRLPDPNLILTSDDTSRSMDIRAAALTAFAASRIGKDGLRLGWQAAGGCASLPADGELCQGVNAPRPLDSVRREQLSTFLQRLAAIQRPREAEAQDLVDKAQAHLDEAESDAALPCRKSFMLLASAGAATTPHGALRVHQLDAGAPDLAGRLVDAVDTVLAQSQSLPTLSVSSITSGILPAPDAPVTLYAARYDAQRWSGEITAMIASEDAPLRPWGVSEVTSLPYTTASLLDQREPDSRVIFTSTGAGKQLRGAPFRWNQLAPEQQAALGNGDERLGEQRLRYLRGDRQDEQARGGNLRDRDSVEGDAVNSSVWYSPGGQAANESTETKRPMLYIGSNDGMLHAFFADSGAEAFAYVPQGAFDGLSALTRPAYRHRYLVDGSPWTSEMRDSTRSTRLLAAGLGAGGRGYFVLDVSNPQDWAKEDTAAQHVVLVDTTAGTDPDIGHILGEPVLEAGNPVRTRQIARLSNGRWALVLGNGPGSERQQAMLLIQFLDGERELLKLPAGAPGGNGLSSVRLVDTTGDDIPEIAYGGDMAGQLWKFSLAGADPDEWKSAFDDRPLFQAQDAGGKPQAISSAPLQVTHPERGRMLIFGTGRLWTDSDRADTRTQTIYGVHDRDESDPVSGGRSALVAQEIQSEPVGSVSGQLAWTSTTRAVPLSGTSVQRGWYVDLPAIGERVVAHPRTYEGKLVDILSIVPPAAFRTGIAAQSCKPPATHGFRTTLNALDGARPKSQLYGDSATALNASRIEMPAQPTVQVRRGATILDIHADGKQDAPRNRLGFITRRASWRQIQ